MKIIIKGLFATYFATVIHGDICCVPEQWEGFLYGAGDLLRATSIEAEIVSYDAVGKRIALSGVSIRDGIKTDAKLIENYSTNKRYFTEPVNRVCTTSTIDIDFPKVCVPDGATLRGTTYVGNGENKLGVKGYSYPVKNHLFDMNIFMVVTENGCIPISSDVRGTYNNTQYFEIHNFIQITTGVNDTNIFTPPDFCNQAILDQTDDKVLREYSIFKFLV